MAVVAALGSPKGDSSQENQLTLARATVVRDYLVKNFRLDDSRIKTIGLPKKAETATGQVQVMIYSTVAPRETSSGH